MSQLACEIPFNDIAAVDEAVTDDVAAVVVEPVIDGPPNDVWLEALRDACDRKGALLVFDEIKTGFRVSIPGWCGQSSVRPDVLVLGKSLANGFPLSAVLSTDAIMEALDHTWISSTLATETVAMAAANAVLDVHEHSSPLEQIRERGEQLVSGLEKLGLTVRGIPQMCYPEFGDKKSDLATGMARRGFLFKGVAYNFPSVAHSDEDVSVL